MTEIRDTIDKFKADLAPFGAKLIAVSKTRTAKEVQAAFAAGQTDFGENYVQELVDKQPQLSEEIRWHFIGHLQSNKVRYIAPFVHCIHTVDSLKLLREINKQAEKHGRVIPCLLQLHIALEETKFGLSKVEAAELLDDPSVSALKNVRITGMMAMASNTDDEKIVRDEFRSMKTFFEEQRIKHPALTELSMGMSGDYLIALEEGSTMVRIGSAIFGERQPVSKS